MAKYLNICMLDYLVGTLATACKGLVASLVVRDFCIKLEGEEAEARGTVFSMPEGRYDMSLIKGGIEVARTELRDGHFSLRVPSPVIEEAKNLQLDVLQRGRHIGTFLLKRGVGGSPCGPALGISLSTLKRKLRRYGLAGNLD
jgi:hypothetical protein